MDTAIDEYFESNYFHDCKYLQVCFWMLLHPPALPLTIPPDLNSSATLSGIPSDICEGWSAEGAADCSGWPGGVPVSPGSAVPVKLALAQACHGHTISCSCPPG